MPERKGLRLGMSELPAKRLVPFLCRLDHFVLQPPEQMFHLAKGRRGRGSERGIHLRDDLDDSIQGATQVCVSLAKRLRSEERRVGKECRSRCGAEQER